MNNFKKIFTINDFHDYFFACSTLYSIAFDEESNRLMFDIDYVFKKTKSINNNHYIWPATLVFENVSNINIETEGEFDIDIDEIVKTNLNNETNIYNWTIRTLYGVNIIFNASEFYLYIRKKPIYTNNLRLTLEEHGDISFCENTYD